MKLETTNLNCFTYRTEELLIELLGGIRIDGLDRMRVTMKVTVVNRKHAGCLTNPELAGLSVRHNLDLYNDTQVEKFVRRVAEKLETGSIALTKAIADITSQLEEYRLKQLDKQETRKEKALSKEEREGAIQFLEQRDLLKRTNEMIGKSGVIGEEANRLLMYLIFTPLLVFAFKLITSLNDLHQQHDFFTTASFLHCFIPQPPSYYLIFVMCEEPQLSTPVS